MGRAPLRIAADVFLIFRKGLDLKHAVAGMLAENYHSQVIARSRTTTSRIARDA